MRLIQLTLLFLFLNGTAYAAEETSASYYVPPTQFSSAIEVMDSGFANAFALFRNGTGSFTFDTAAKSMSNLKLAVDATSITAGNSETERALAALIGPTEIRVTAPDSLTFNDNKAQLKANVTFRGITKPVPIEATLNKAGKSARAGGMWSSEGDAVGISLRLSIKRADFGIIDSPDAPARFGDTINMMLEAQAIRQ